MVPEYTNTPTTISFSPFSPLVVCSKLFHSRISNTICPASSRRGGHCLAARCHKERGSTGKATPDSKLTDTTCVQHYWQENLHVYTVHVPSHYRVMWNLYDDNVSEIVYKGTWLQCLYVTVTIIWSHLIHYYGYTGVWYVMPTYLFSYNSKSLGNVYMNGIGATTLVQECQLQVRHWKCKSPIIDMM